MEPIEEHRARNGSINLVILKAEIPSALSGVGSATTTEELRQADAAYRKALYAARSIGYCPHIRAADGQQKWTAERRFHLGMVSTACLQGLHR